MNINFIIVQSIGILAWLVLIASYYRENTNKILIFQIIATALYCLHYYLLGAYSGLFICIFEVIRDYLYYKTDLDDYIFACSIPVYTLNAFVTFTGWYDILPTFSSLLDGYTLTKKKNVVVFGAVISYTSWVIYDLSVMSYSCAITDGLVALSNVCILLFENSPLKKLKVINKKISLDFKKK